VVDHTPNIEGEAVTGFDYAGLSISLTIGTGLLFHSISPFFRPARIARAVHLYMSIHRRWSDSLASRGVIRIPGSGRVDPVKSWFASELFFTGCLVAGISSRTMSGAAIGFFIGMPAALALFVLSVRSESRKVLDSFRRDLPLTAFLMSLFLESGLGPASALRETVRALPAGPCADELHEIGRSRELGMPRRESFDRSGSRIPLEDYRSFLNLIEQGDRLGIGLSRGLRDLSDRLQESQAHRAEMIAQKAAVKLLFPLVVFIFPAVFLVVLSPVLLHLLRMGGR
jgi:pilus assembly protein TadC